jgi:hypothetical protein
MNTELTRKRFRSDRQGRRFSCELCLKPNLSTPHHTICDACDTELKEIQAQEDEKRRQKIAHRRCRLCAGYLEPARYFSCKSCVPDSVMESEDTTWEAADSVDYGDENQHKIKVRANRVTEKECKACKQIKPTTEFSPRNKNRTERLGDFRPRCKPCHSIYDKEKTQARLARLKTSAIEEAV